MSTFSQDFRVSIIATISMAILLCGAYPLAVWGIAQFAFPRQANGSLLTNNKGELIGSSLIGQTFDDPRYFHSRPSAAGNGYDAANSGGSNLGPLSQKLITSVQERVENYRKVNGLASDTPIPADAVTASASGLDPHISIENAFLQSVRVAKIRGMEIEEVRQLIKQNTGERQWGFLGEPAVNVVLLNLALDKNN